MLFDEGINVSFYVEESIKGVKIALHSLIDSVELHSNLKHINHTAR